MWALRLHGPGFGNLRLEEVPTPKPAAGQLLARVEAALVCASDLKIIEQGSDHTLMYGWDLSRHPVPIGHEGCLTVARVGEGLPDEYAIGRRFAVQPAVPAAPRHHRDRYRDQAEGLDKVLIGYTLDGLFAEYVLITEEVIETGCLLPLPDPQLPSYAAALAEPLSCVVSAQEHTVHILKGGPTQPRAPRLGPKPGGLVVVVGAGPMGRLHVELALLHGPSKIIVSDPNSARLERLRATLAAKAERRGISLVCTRPDRLPSVVSTESGGRGADDLILAVGIRNVQEQSLSLLAKGGVANLFGGLKSGDHTLSLDARRLHYDSISLVGSSGGDPSDVAKALSLLADGAVDAGAYIAAVGGLDAATGLLEAVRDQRLDGKALIYPALRSPLRFVEGWSADKERAFLGR